MKHLPFWFDVPFREFHFSCRFVQVGVTFLLPPDIKGLKPNLTSKLTGVSYFFRKKIRFGCLTRFFMRLYSFLYMWYFVWFGTISTILKMWKKPWRNATFSNVADFSTINFSKNVLEILRSTELSED